eukprot:NODE_151_length_15465_cov_0.405376.p3 type:complete len:420 gc:universal NODE_151_length_15465_cov_0.405376:9602-8343(-)
MISPKTARQTARQAPARSQHVLTRCICQIIPMKQYEHVVVGAGPASLALIGKLLDKQFKNILWVDPYFDGGRLSKYDLVPSNTKIKLFTEFANQCHSFHNLNSPSLLKMKEMDPNANCHLNYPCEMVKELSNQIIQNQMVDHFKGCITQIHYKQPFDYELHMSNDSVDLESDDPFSNIKTNQIIQSQHIYLTTGSKPVQPVNGPHLVNPLMKLIDLDTALHPIQLTNQIQPNSKIAVIGNSHSAILILRNLHHLNMKYNHTLTIKCFHRHPLKYAEYYPDYIKYDNTGLKGEAANWAKEELMNTDIQMIQLENEDVQYAQEMPNMDYLIYAIGFQQRTLPRITTPDTGTPSDSVTSTSSGTSNKIHHDVLSGQIYQNDVKLEGLKGFGIAFPEQVTDKHGNQEMNVGMWKFMTYLNKLY